MRRAGKAESPTSAIVKKVRALTQANFADLEELFAGKGCSFARGCWCMGYRLRGRPKPPDGMTTAAYNRSLLLALAAKDTTPGLIGYDAAGVPVGWVTAGPRDDFARLARSPVMNPVDSKPVWVVVCFVVPTPYRGKGVATAMLGHAIEHARSQGARAIEGFPIDKVSRSADQWLWHGTLTMFTAAGFREVARRKPERPVMRLDLS